ncbi:type III secretion system rspD [Pseudomonas fluorescens WH6]|nr:type III secretion system rspD [Pseudomonas fluorescens WH6]
MPRPCRRKRYYLQMILCSCYVYGLSLQSGNACDCAFPCASARSGKKPPPIHRRCESPGYPVAGRGVAHDNIFKQ